MSWRRFHFIRGWRRGLLAIVSASEANILKLFSLRAAQKLISCSWDNDLELAFFFSFSFLNGIICFFGLCPNTVSRIQHLKKIALWLLMETISIIRQNKRNSPISGPVFGFRVLSINCRCIFFYFFYLFLFIFFRFEISILFLIRSLSDHQDHFLC